ncbi:MAG: hypothetical protein Q8M44_02855, partial [bacterium]|nr:hypothetical protein [bacterium]
ITASTSCTFVSIYTFHHLFNSSGITIIHNISLDELFIIFDLIYKFHHFTIIVFFHSKFQVVSFISTLAHAKLPKYIIFHNFFQPLPLDSHQDHDKFVI